MATNMYNCGYIAWETYKTFTGRDKGSGSWILVIEILTAAVLFSLL